MMMQMVEKPMVSYYLVGWEGQFELGEDQMLAGFVCLRHQVHLPNIQHLVTDFWDNEKQIQNSLIGTINRACTFFEIVN